MQTLKAILRGVLVLALAVPPAVTFEPGGGRGFERPAPAVAREAPELAPVMVVLDASGSMRAGDRMPSAKKAVRSLVEQAPEGAELGLTVYGTGTGNSSAEKAKGCKDVKVVHKPGEADADTFKKSVDGVRPRGYTPIGESLKVAAAALPKDGPRSIVLVSDGEDTCAPPDPCEVAKDLAEDGVDMRVHSVGFGVDGKAKKQLTCVAQATGGTYSDAKGGKDLIRVLPRVVRQALRNYEPAGVPISGGSDHASAAALEPGSYLDQIDHQEKKYYAIDVPAGYTVYATATAVYAEDGDSSLTNEKLYARLYDAEEKSCGGRYTFRRFRVRVATSPRSWTVPKPEEAVERRPCNMPGKYVFEVERERVRDVVQGPAPLELRFTLEPPIASGGEGPLREDRVEFAEPGGKPTQVIGGGSFGSAAQLDGPGLYTDTLHAGEQVFFRIHLKWGQGLAYKVRAPDGERNKTQLRAFTYGPTRTLLHRHLSRNYFGRAMELVPPPTHPIRYQNRGRLSSEKDVGQALEGTYYIAVQGYAESTEEALPPVDVTLAVSVVGDPEQGPAYAGQLRGSAQQGPEGTPSAEPPAGGPANGDDQGPISLISNAGPAVWIGGPVVLVLVAGAIWLLVKHGRARPAGPVPGLYAPGPPSGPPPGPPGPPQERQ